MRMGLLARAMRKPVQDGGLYQGGILDGARGRRPVTRRGRPSCSRALIAEPGGRDFPQPASNSHSWPASRGQAALPRTSNLPNATPAGCHQKCNQRPAPGRTGVHSNAHDRAEPHNWQALERTGRTATRPARHPLSSFATRRHSALNYLSPLAQENCPRVPRKPATDASGTRSSSRPGSGFRRCRGVLLGPRLAPRPRARPAWRETTRAARPGRRGSRYGR